MSHFTPGPWSDGSDADYVVRAGKGNPVATMNPEHPLEERAANARLISAAPELVDAGAIAAGALRACVDILRQIGHVRTAEMVGTAAEKMMAALAKAVPA